MFEQAVLLWLGHLRLICQLLANQIKIVLVSAGAKIVEVSGVCNVSTWVNCRTRKRHHTWCGLAVVVHFNEMHSSDCRPILVLAAYPKQKVESV